MSALTEEWVKDWVKEWGKKINESKQYRQAAQTWEWPLIMIFEKDPSVGVDKDWPIYLDLWRGECREARLATEEDIENVPYVISADLYTWKQIFDRKLEPITTIMRGRIKLIKGNMSTLSAYVLAAKYLVESALEIDAEFPVELK